MATIGEYTKGRSRDEAYRLLVMAFALDRKLDIEFDNWKPQDEKDFARMVALLNKQYE